MKKGPPLFTLGGWEEKTDPGRKGRSAQQARSSPQAAGARREEPPP